MDSDRDEIRPHHGAVVAEVKESTEWNIRVEETAKARN